MDRFVHNNEFNRDVIYQKLADISSKLEEEQENKVNEVIIITNPFLNRLKNIALPLSQLF